MRKQNAAFQTAFTSEANQGLKNTDCFGFVELDDFACYVIADGIDDVVDAMGARLAVDTVISVFTEAPSMKKSTVLRCLNAANRALLTADSKMNLKASMTVIITNYVKLMYGQAGNTRLRLYRDGFCRVQSADQSLSMDLVFGERLEPDKLTKHEERNNLYCYLGQGNDFRPFISKAIKLVNSDAVSLSTRGVWENVDEGELQDCFSEATDNPAPTVESIEDVLLTKQPAELEKYTLAVIFVNKIFIEPNKKQKIKKILAAAIPVAVVVVTAVIVIAVFLTMRAKNIEEMTQSFSDTIEYIQSDNYSRANHSRHGRKHRR